MPTSPTTFDTFTVISTTTGPASVRSSPAVFHRSVPSFATVAPRAWRSCTRRPRTPRPRWPTQLQNYESAVHDGPIHLWNRLFGFRYFSPWRYLRGFLFVVIFIIIVIIFTILNLRHPVCSTGNGRISACVVSVPAGCFCSRPRWYIRALWIVLCVELSGLLWAGWRILGVSFLSLVCRVSFPFASSIHSRCSDRIPSRCIEIRNEGLAFCLNWLIEMAVFGEISVTRGRLYSSRDRNRLGKGDCKTCMRPINQAKL